MLKALIVDGDYHWADRFASNAYSSDMLTVVGIEQDGYKAAGRIYEQRPDLVLVDQTAQNGEGVKVLEKLVKESPDTIFIFTTANRTDMLLWRLAMSKGATAVIYKDYGINQVVEIASRHLSNAHPLGTEEADLPAKGTPSVRPPAAAERQGDGRLVKTGAGSTGVVKQEIITVYSPKGGVGKSTIACNLAVAIAASKSVPIKACLVDLDVSFGTVATIMDVKTNAKYSVLDWAGYSVEEFDRRLVDQLVVKHKTGLDIVPAAPRAEDSAYINEKDESGVSKGKALAEKMIKVLRNYYDLIVFDVGPSLREDSTIEVIDNSTKVLLVSTPDIPTMTNVVNCQRTFEHIGIDQSKIRVVLNRVTKNNGLDMGMVGQITRYMVAVKIADDPGLQKLTNAGKLSVLDAQGSLFANGIHSLVSTVMPVYNVKKKVGLFAKLFGGKNKNGW